MLRSRPPPTVHNSQEEPSFTFPTHRFRLGFKTGNLPAASHNFCLTFQCVFSGGGGPSLAALTDVFKDAGCRGINQQKSPILSVQSQVDQIAIEKPSSPTHQVAGRDFMLRDSCRLQLIMASSNLNFNILYIYTYIRI